MIGTLILAAALSLTPSQGGTLNATNVRTTYGELGAVRTDNKYLPGDFFFLAFDIEGITVSPEGKIAYTMEMQVTDKAGKVVYKPEKPADSEEMLPLGGPRLPSRAYVLLKQDQEPGTYTCRVTFTDKATKASKVIERQFEVIPKTFGIIDFVTTNDEKGEQLAPPIGVVGQNLFVHFVLTGMFRGADKKPNAVVELRLFDQANKPTLAKPISVAVPRELPDGEPALFRFAIPFNREGSFTAEVKATDNVSGKTSVVTFPIKVNPR